MRELAEGVWQLSGFPRDQINVYVLGDVLIDSGLALDRQRILRQLADRPITAHAITHAHVDHYGSSHEICKRLGLPFWCGSRDVEAVQAGKMVGPGGRMLPGPGASGQSRGL